MSLPQGDKGCRSILNLNIRIMIHRGIYSERELAMVKARGAGLYLQAHCYI